MEVMKSKRDQASMPRRRRRLVVWLSVGFGVVVVAVVGTDIAVQQQTVSRYSNCYVDGKLLNARGHTTIDTEQCGSLDVAGGKETYDAMRVDSTYDFTTRGFVFGLPPIPSVIHLSLVHS